MSISCSHCQHWQPEDNANDGCGSCRHHSPTNNGYGPWPATYGTDWCRDFKAAVDWHLICPCPHCGVALNAVYNEHAGALFVSTIELHKETP